MILPTKHLSEHRAILSVGAEILRILGEPMTVSRLWEEIKSRPKTSFKIRLSFDWFVLTLDWLYMSRAIDLQNGRIHKQHSKS